MEPIEQNKSSATLETLTLDFSVTAEVKRCGGAF